jgi:hypothetical protein
MVTVGLDIAKQTFQAHGADGIGKVVLRKRQKRAEVGFVLRRPRTLSDWMGSQRRSAPLVSGIEPVGTHGATDCSAVRQALSEVAEERRQRC